jgi:uncharacterized protein
MIIYWKIGEECNLNCNYCNIPNINKNSLPKNIERKKIQRFNNSIEKIINKNNGGNKENLIIVFYGGEPLLYLDEIKRFIDKFYEKNIKFVLHTNGILLEKLDKSFLSNLDMILVSIDGGKNINDDHRGIGTYLQIKKGVEKIRNNYNGEIIARSTLTLDSSIKDVVNDLDKWLDGIYWQIENSPTYAPNICNQFLLRYNEDINILIDEWIKNALNGKISNLLPFQAIASTILMNKKEKYLRCGCGSRLIITDGEKCYSCDELANVSNDVNLGNFNENTNPYSQLINNKLNNICNNCSIRYICGGRCYNSLAFFPRTKFNFYCDATHISVKGIQSAVPILDRLLNEGSINMNQLLHPALEVIDQIP